MPAYNKITPAAAAALRACGSPGRVFFGGIDGVTEDVKLVFKFATPYPEGETVILAIGIVPPEGEAEWLVKEGIANADGDVEVTVTKEELQKISDNPFVVIPVSK